ncbi:GNAT family N-acetyltransferase [Glutamicibacter sp.]|uniref:GNAT family N-acetyltransferase n=1 Tax=Glutamicibacter sp. TaxID=1931995 RepID=UPI002B46F36B|nr:GNAT family N-acetyltransferase [Glutamicibacter sp.]HJX78652.1 GNAT family N-acetyltransferase [Glutamicibacter sp.]
MPSDVLQADLQHSDFTPTVSPYAVICRAEPLSSAALAAAYFAAYPPGVAAGTLAEAQTEMKESFAHEFGHLLENASFVALHQGSPIGAIFVVEESIWDEDISGPFIIDLFVDPRHQGQGLGRALISAAMSACKAYGADTLSLRIGDGTSGAALELYKRLGFRELV